MRQRSCTSAHRRRDHQPRCQAAGRARARNRHAGNRRQAAYTLTADFEKLSPAAVGQLLGSDWRGGTFDADGKIDLSGYTDKDLAGSAKGTLHFEWRHGAIAAGAFRRHWPVSTAGPPTPRSRMARLRWGRTKLCKAAASARWRPQVTLGEPPKVRLCRATEAGEREESRWVSEG